MIILSLNCGSSSVKYQLYDWTGKIVIATGVVERVTIGESFCVYEVNGRVAMKIPHECPTHKEAIDIIVKSLTHKDHGVLKDIHEIVAVGHRVVHGGEQFAKSVIIGDNEIAEFEKLAKLAPLHNPPNIMGIKAAMQLIPDVPHMAIMDTAWHQTMPATSYIYALPYEWYEKYGLRRYGFHGTSLLYVAKRAAVLLGKDPFDVNLVSLHIGNGVSVNAVKNGCSFDTSMGFTPLEGAVMGTRAGDHDAAIDLYIMEEEGLDPKAMTTILNKKSGLLGITGKYVDRRDITEAAADGDRRSRLAVDIEAYRLKKYIGAYTAALGSVDALVFTAGAGVKDDILREKILDGLQPMGIVFDPGKNRIARSMNIEMDITGPGSSARILIIPTDEELVFIEDVVALLENKYDIHTKFTYSFQEPGYRNRMRDANFARECEAKPYLKDLIPDIPR
ncbi:acetate kinase [bacterium]|nr:acetate kinase [candidate division CSSED10-310 bacterium]